MTEVKRERRKGRQRICWLGERGEEGEYDREANRISSGGHGSTQGLSRGKRRAGQQQQRVIDGGACHAAGSAERKRSGRKGSVIKVAETDADGAVARCASGKVGNGKATAERVAEHGRTHEEQVIKKLHEGKAVAKGDAP